MATVNTTALTPIAMPGVQTRLTDQEEQEVLRVLRNANSLAIGPTGGIENNALESDFTKFTGCAD